MIITYKNPLLGQPSVNHMKRTYAGVISLVKYVFVYILNSLRIQKCDAKSQNVLFKMW